MKTTPETLDLVDIALLLNYERVTTEPETRHTQLREVAYPGSLPQTKRVADIDDDGWVDNARTWIILDKLPGKPTGPDQFSYALSPAQSVRRERLTSKQLETVSAQARNYNGCYQAVGLLQIFFELFPADTNLRIRHASDVRGGGASYVTNIHRRTIIEETLLFPKFSTVIITPRKYMASGCFAEMDHAVVGFHPLDSSAVTSVLDLSSMQFGDVGRGPGLIGKELFALDTIPEFEARINKIADGTDPSKSNRSVHIKSTPVDDWLGEVAARAKQRWDNRATQKWCGHCGSPEATFRCGSCGEARYCGKEHQTLGWKFHKGHCKLTLVN